MGNLGYTFYPKDWWTSDTFYELPPELRYIYLEIISLMYLNDGVWRADRTVLLKRFGVDVGEAGYKLLQERFTVLEGGIWTHESVNKRLKKAKANRENGQKGGRPPKPKKPNLETQKNPPLEKKEKLKGKETKEKVVAPDFYEKWNSKDYVKKMVGNTITPKRMILLNTLNEKFSSAEIYAALDKCDSDYFNKHWTLPVDWFLELDNFQKIIEGNYDDNNKQEPAPSITVHKGFKRD